MASTNLSQKVVIDGKVIAPGVYATHVDYANGGKVTFTRLGPPRFSDARFTQNSKGVAVEQDDGK